MCLLRRVENYLRASGISPSRLGREAVGDPRFVFELRNGREPRTPLTRRLCAYLEAGEKSVGARSCSR